MKRIWMGVAVVAMLSLGASAQIWHRNDRNRNSGIYGSQYPNNGGYQNTAAYNDGYKAGQDDARHGRTSSTRVDKYHNDNDRAAWDQGYRDGYGSMNSTGVY